MLGFRRGAPHIARAICRLCEELRVDDFLLSARLPSRSTTWYLI